MIQALAPRWPRGFSWVLLSVVSWGLVVPARAQDQSESKAKSTAKSAVKPDATKVEDRPDDPSKLKSFPTTVETQELWQDPRAAGALQKFDEVPSIPLREQEIAAVKQMASGQGALDRALVEKYVRHFTAELTRQNNIKPILDPESKPKDAKLLESLTADLLDPLMRSANSAGATFRRAYVKALVDVAPRLLSGNYHSRHMIMIVLSRTGDPQAMKIFIDQLNDPDQILVVKILAAVGLSNIAQHGRRPPDPSLAAPAAKALSEFLERETDTYWYAQFRAIEALGALRLASANPRNGQAELAATALGFLANPTARPQVRAWAAWALGMIQVPPEIKPYNFRLVAYCMGRFAVDVGKLMELVPLPLPKDGKNSDEVSEKAQIRTKNMPLILRSTDLLLQVMLALRGESEARFSGLLKSDHSDAAGAQAYVNEVERRVKALTGAAINLSQAAGVQIPTAQKALAAAVDDLDNFLAKPPADLTLFPGADPIQVNPAQVAGAKP